MKSDLVTHRYKSLIPPRYQAQAKLDWTEHKLHLLSYSKFEWTFKYCCAEKFKSAFTPQCECAWEALRTWAVLKAAIRSVEQERLALLCLKWCLTLPGQQLYKLACESFLNPINHDEEVKFPDDMGPDNLDDFYEFQDRLYELKGTSKFFPYSFFPKLYFEKKSKMEWAFKDRPSDQQCTRFRDTFAKFLGKYAPEEIFVPPPSSVYKHGGTRFNDGGKVKFDFEKTESFDSGFLYQRFVTQPLQIREVWLPGKAQKLNSSYWFEVCRPILSRVPYALLGKDINEFVEKIMERTKDRKSFSSYDLYGFGFQYPREYLLIMMEEISMLYPNLLLDESTEIARELFKALSVQMPDGKFVYPPRGIGLGYYETLKTLGMMAVFDSFDPVVIWGDEGLLKNSNYDEAIAELRSLGFYDNLEKRINYHGSNRLYYGGITVHLQSGAMSLPFAQNNGIAPLFQCKTHWERKNSINNIVLPKSSAYTHMCYTYERTFGYEFFVGESLMHPINYGINRRAPPIRGWVKTAELEALLKPGERRLDKMIASLPILTIKSHKNDMDWARLRKSIFRKGGKVPTYLNDFLNPKVRLGEETIADRNDLARTVPLWQEKRMIFYNRLHAQKWTRGLKDADLYKAATSFNRSADPFGIYHYKGSHYTTPFHISTFLSEEWEDTIDYLLTCRTISDFKTLRADVMSPLDVELRRIRQASALQKQRGTDLAVKTATDKLLGDLIRNAPGLAKRPTEESSFSERVKRIREDSITPEPENTEETSMIVDVSNNELEDLEFDELLFLEGAPPEELHVEAALFLDDSFGLDFV
jgi:hypothetical protein